MDILVRRRAGMGDLLLATPVLAALGRRHVGARIFVETDHPAVLEGNPWVAGASRCFHARAWGAVFGLDLAYERRPFMHVVDAYADECGVRAETRRPALYCHLSAGARAASVAMGAGRWVAMHVAGPSAWPGRVWGQAGFAAVSAALSARGWKVVLVGGERAAPGAPCDLDLRERTTSAEVGAAIARCGLFVGLDSFPMHVACALSVPCVGLFGSVDPALRLPGTADAVGVTAPQHSVWCLGCHHHLPAPRTTGSCARDRVYCMEMLSPGDVLQAALRVLGEGAATPPPPYSSLSSTTRKE